MTPMTIYDLKLHEDIITKGLRIMRVPGGWLYENCQYPLPPVFVPYNNEFSPPQNRDHQWLADLMATGE